MDKHKVPGYFDRPITEQEKKELIGRLHDLEDKLGLAGETLRTATRNLLTTAITIKLLRSDLAALSRDMTVALQRSSSKS